MISFLIMRRLILIHMPHKSRLLYKIAADTSDLQLEIINDFIQHDEQNPTQKKLPDILDSAQTIFQTITKPISSSTNTQQGVRDQNKLDQINNELAIFHQNTYNNTPQRNTENLYQLYRKLADKKPDKTNNTYAEDIQEYINAVLNIKSLLKDKSNALNWIKENTDIDTIEKQLYPTNYDFKLLLNNINLSQLSNDELVSTYKYRSTIYYIYIYENSGDNKFYGIITKNNQILFSYIVDVPERLQFLFDKCEEIIQADINNNNEDLISKFNKRINPNYQYPPHAQKSNMTIGNNNIFPTNISQDNTNDSIPSDKIEQLNINVAYSHFNILQKLLGICIKAKKDKDPCLVKFKLTQKASNDNSLNTNASNITRLKRKKILRGLYKQAVTRNNILESFTKLFRQNGSIVTNIQLIASYFNPKIEETSQTDVARAEENSNDCVGILCKVDNKLFAIPCSAQTTLISFNNEYQRIYDNLKNSNILKNIPAYSRQIVSNIANILVSPLKKLKNILTEQDVNTLSSYNQDILAVVLNRRLDEMLHLNSNNTDQAFLELIQKQIPIIKSFSIGEAAQADTYLRTATASQYTFLHDTSYKNHIKFNADAQGNSPPDNSPTPPVKPGETIMTLEMHIIPGSLSNSAFLAGLNNWVTTYTTGNDNIILNYTDVKSKMQQLIKL